MLSETLQYELSRAVDTAWMVAAFTALQRGNLAPELRAAAQDVVVRSGLPGDPDADLAFADAVTSQLRQLAAFATYGGSSWSEVDELTARVQGAGSRQVGRWLAERTFPALGLADRLGRPGGRFLEIGIGTGQLAVEMAARYPRLHIVGVDPMARVLEIAKEVTAEAGCADRVDMRRGSVADLDEEAGYDVAWLPACFIAEPAIDAGLPRLLRALRPDGWLVATAVTASADVPIADAVNRMVALIQGGSNLTGEDLADRLARAGFADVARMPGNPLTGALIVGRRERTV